MTTQADIARANNLSPSTLSGIVCSFGVTPQEAVEIIISKRKRKTGKQLCADACVDYQAVKYAKNTHGLHDWQEAIDLVRKRDSQKTVKQLCQDAGVPLYTVYRLRSYRGMTTKQAIDHIKGGPRTVKAMALQHGIDPQQVYNMAYRKAISHSEAIARMVRWRSNNSVRPYNNTI
jgi:hypothetical protein